jgi:glutamyl-tRNA synthetase
MRGRLAPSPTGALHLGNARSFLLAWLQARKTGAEVLLRVEDLESPRIKIGAVAEVLEDLQWLGLDWDSGPIFQSSSLAPYQSALEKLVSKEWVYPCVCTRREIENAIRAPHAGEEGPIYPGTCRDKDWTFDEAERSSGRKPCWRFKVPDTRVQWKDGFLGEQSFQMQEELGDFVVWGKGGEPAYQLAVVVDDAGQSINQVLRGDDLLTSTARQLLLYQAFGDHPPEFIHVPLVIGTDGLRLAKRHGDTTLRGLRQAGFSADDVLQWLAKSSGMVGVLGSGRPISPINLIPFWELHRLEKKPVIWEGPDCLQTK